MKNTKSLTLGTLGMLLFSFAQPVYGTQIEMHAILIEPGKSYLPETSNIPPVITPIITPSGKEITRMQFYSRATTEDIAIDLKGEGKGTKVLLPAGLTMTAPTWNGTIDVNFTTKIPPTMPDITSGKAVSIQFTGMSGKSVGLDKAAVVAIPYDNFGNVTKPIVQVTDMTNTVYTLGPCSNTQYLGGPFAEPDSYSLANYITAGPKQCYKYDDTSVYAITNHFSTFMAGVASPSAVVIPTLEPEPSSTPTPSQSNSGGGGGSNGTNNQPISSFSASSALDKTCSFSTMPVKKIYEDVPSDTWYSAAITRMTDIGILKKNKKFFRPSGKLRRREALMLIMDAFDIKPESSKTGNTWIEYLNKAKQVGIIIPEKPSLAPLGIINRAEAIALIMRAGKVNLSEYQNTLITKKRYRDVQKKQWYFSYVMKASDLCIITKDKKTFSPTKAASRAEFIVMLDRAIQKLKPQEN